LLFSPPFTKIFFRRGSPRTFPPTSCNFRQKSHASQPGFFPDSLPFWFLPHGLPLPKSGGDCSPLSFPFFLLVKSATRFPPRGFFLSPSYCVLDPLSNHYHVPFFFFAYRYLSPDEELRLPSLFLRKTFLSLTFSFETLGVPSSLFSYSQNVPLRTWEVSPSCLSFRFFGVYANLDADNFVLLPFPFQ